MATYIPAKVSTQYVFFAALVSQANTKLMQVNPTIAAGDFKVSIDGGALANLGTLPAVTPAGSSMVKFTLAVAEMAGANATVICTDAAGAEWCDLVINIPTAARQVDDLAYPATSGRSMVVDAAGLVDANTVKVGASGAGTAQTARDLGLALPAAAPNAANGLLITLAGSLDMDEMNVDIEAIQTSTGGLTYTVANQVDVNVVDWKGAAAAAMTGDAYARLGAPAGASVSADVAAVKVDTAAVKVQTDKLTFTVANKLDSNVYTWNGTAVSAPATAGIPEVNVKNINNVSAAAVTTVKAVQGLTTADVIASVTGAVGSVTGAVGSVTGNVGGNVVGSVASVTAAVAITSHVKRNQALANFTFLMTDATTHAPATELGGFAVTRSIDGGFFAGGTLSGITEVTNGIYRVDFAAGDLDGKVIILRVTATGADDSFERIITQI